MAPTIRDVAERAGVHASTVSRALSGNGKISATTQQRVLLAAEALGWRPNAQARSLSRNVTNRLGLLIPHITDDLPIDPYFFPHLIRGLLAAAREEGFCLVLGGSADERDEIEQGVHMLRSRLVDGLLLLHPRPSTALIGALQGEARPFIVVGQPLDPPADLYYVDPDPQGGACEAIRYLLALGHRRIAFLGAHLGGARSQLQLAGYREAIESAALPFDPDLVVHADPATDLPPVATLLERGTTAIYTTSDILALSMLRGLAERGVSVPDHLSIMACDDSVITRHTRPPISSIYIPVVEAAREGVQLLIRLIRGENPSLARRLSCRLVVRASTAPPP